METERRDTTRRATLVRCLLDGIVQHPRLMLSVPALQQWLQVPVDAAERLIRRLIDAGVIREVQPGVWIGGALPGAQRQRG